MVEEPYDVILRDLALPNVEIHGKYHAGSIVEQLQEMSLSLHLSIWPETYCITLSEAWQAGVVPIVSDVGAIGERVSHGINGFKVPMEGPGTVVDILRQLIAQPGLIEKARMQINSGLIVTRDTHISWLKCLYDKLLCDSFLDMPSTSNHFPESRISLSDCGIVLNQRTWTRPQNTDQPLIQAIIRNDTKKFESLLNKVIRYRRSNGTGATMVRAMREIRRVINNAAGRT